MEFKQGDVLRGRFGHHDWEKDSPNWEPIQNHTVDYVQDCGDYQLFTINGREFDTDNIEDIQAHAFPGRDTTFRWSVSCGDDWVFEFDNSKIKQEGVTFQIEDANGIKPDGESVFDTYGDAVEHCQYLFRQEDEFLKDPDVTEITSTSWVVECRPSDTQLWIRREEA